MILRFLLMNFCADYQELILVRRNIEYWRDFHEGRSEQYVWPRRIRRSYRLCVLWGLVTTLISNPVLAFFGGIGIVVGPLGLLGKFVWKLISGFLSY